MDESELNAMREEIRTLNDLVLYNMKNHFIPLTSKGMLYLIDRVQGLRKQLADMEARMMRELYNQIQCN